VSTNQPPSSPSEPASDSSRGSDPHETALLEHEDEEAAIEMAPGLELIDAPIAPPQWSFGGEAPPIVPGMPVLAMDDDDGDDGPVKLQRRKVEEAEMDMTPMVDVTFQLLIFFMLTTSFALQKSLQIPKPQQSSSSAASTKTLEDIQNDSTLVTVRVDASGTFFIESARSESEIEAPSEQELLSQLRIASQPDESGTRATKLLVMAHGDALHERVVMALDAGVNVGMNEIQLLASEEE
jgi:biopolymer transport protein ExbD